MRYLIDGYNLLFRIQGKKYPTFEKRRQALIELLDKELAPIKGEISLIFDSSEQIRDFAQSAALTHLDVLYAPRGKSADDYIVELIEISPNPKIEVVVTSDRGLANQCRSLGANIQTVEEFLSFAAKKSPKAPDSKPTYVEHPSEIERLRKIFEENSPKENS